MSFVQNGSFEAFAQASAEIKQNTSESNPFGLKDFSKLLDAKFGNSAFSDNILQAPKGDIGKTNPFDKNAVDKLKQSKLPNTSGGNVTKTGGVGKIAAKNSGDGGDGNSSNFASTSIFDGLQINKGTGFAKGGAGRHKLDFCY